jgi:hypothetical protein
VPGQLEHGQLIGLLLCPEVVKHVRRTRKLHNTGQCV